MESVNRNNLSRLEVLTDLVELAERQMAKGSPYTSGWADTSTLNKWYDTIAYLRKILPEHIVKGFDDERKWRREFLAEIDRESCRCV